MKIQVGNFLMHEKAMDVCVEIHQTLGPDYAYIRYWNLGYTGKPWLVDPEIYRVPTQVLESNEWALLEPDQLITPRLTTGVPGNA